MDVEVWQEYNLHTAVQSNKSPQVFLTSGYSCTFFFFFFERINIKNDAFLSGAKLKLMLKLTAFRWVELSEVQYAYFSILHRHLSSAVCWRTTPAWTYTSRQEAVLLLSSLPSCSFSSSLQLIGLFFIFHQTWRGLFLLSCSYLTVCYLRSSVSGARRPDLYLSRRIRCREASWSLALSLLPGLVSWVGVFFSLMGLGGITVLPF